MHKQSHKAVPFLFLVNTITLVSSVLRAQEIRLQKGTALHIAVDHRVRNRLGASVTGHLTEPVYAIDRKVVPAGASATGTIHGERGGSVHERVLRLVAGDFTPLRTPELTFETLAVPDGKGGTQILRIDAPAIQTNASVLRLGVKAHKQTTKTRIKDAVQSGKDALRSNRDELMQAIKHPYLGERVERWAINQLPYHPEMIWTGTRFNADLSSDVAFVAAPHVALPVTSLGGRLPDGVLHARLVAALTSQSAKRGDPVEAVITQPLLSPDKSHVLVPEGTPLHGVVVQTRAARSFGRNGSLRFAFQSLDLLSAEGTFSKMEVHGRLSAAETAPDQHISMDEEGQVKASDGPAKVAEPLLLGVLAVAATPDQHDQAEGGVGAGTTTIAANGFGLIARVASLATRNTGVLQGFAYFSLGKSIYFHYIAKGHDTTFQKDTEMEVTLSER